LGDLYRNRGAERQRGFELQDEAFVAGCQLGQAAGELAYHPGFNRLPEPQHQCVEAGAGEPQRRSRRIGRRRLAQAGKLGKEGGGLGHGRTLRCFGLTPVNRLRRLIQPVRSL
jgi:hypothetical protein